MIVSIIIVSYNTAEMTVAAICSIYKETTNLKFEIIVVDNDSTDNSVALIEQYYPEINLIKLKKNVGFAAANNFAARKATGEYILLLNPDTVVLDNAIEKILVFAIKNPEWGIYGGSTFFEDGSRNTTAGWMKASPWSMFCFAIGLAKIFPRSKLFNPESLASWNWEKPRKSDIITGCFMLLKKTTWDVLGGFDLQFFMYGEDADLCLRASKNGLMSIIYPEAKIIHYGGASEFNKVDKMVRLYKAKTKLFYTHYSGFSAKILISLLKLICLCRIVMFNIGIVFKIDFSYRKKYWSELWKKRNEWSVL